MTTATDELVQIDKPGSPWHGRKGTVVRVEGPRTLISLHTDERPGVTGKLLCVPMWVLNEYLRPDRSNWPSDESLQLMQEEAKTDRETAMKLEEITGEMAEAGYESDFA